jgi:hypothetical protein
VPEPLSLNGGTETLRYIDGDSGGDGWQHQHDERGLRSAARLLRNIHDASVDWQPAADAVFDAPPGNHGNQVYCNGDPGPWNFVWRNGEAVALLDWDFLHPAPRLDDVAYALLWFAPMRDDEACLRWHHFSEVPDRRARIHAFLDAYGMMASFDVAQAVINRRHETIEHVRFLADQGVEPQRTWVAEGRPPRSTGLKQTGPSSRPKPLRAAHAHRGTSELRVVSPYDVRLEKQMWMCPVALSVSSATTRCAKVVTVAIGCRPIALSPRASGTLRDVQAATGPAVGSQGRDVTVSHPRNVSVASMRSVYSTRSSPGPQRM